MLREAQPDLLLTTFQQSWRELVSIATSARLSSSLVHEEDEVGSVGTYCICQASTGAQGFRNRGHLEGQT